MKDIVGQVGSSNPYVQIMNIMVKKLMSHLGFEENGRNGKFFNMKEK
jgi:hypothetical protein